MNGQQIAVPRVSLIVLLARVGFLSVCLNLLSVSAFLSAADAQAVAFLVRHADRLDWSEDTRLSKAGEERARRLAALLKDAGITTIYTTEFQRTQKTAEPLAHILNIRPMIFHHRNHEDPVKRIKRQTQTEIALVIGHDSTIPPMLKMFGYADPITIAPNEYDNLFVLIANDNSRPAVIRLRY